MRTIAHAQYEIIQRDGYSNLQESLDAVNDWAVPNKMQLNPKKTKDMWICFRNDIEPPLLTLANDIIERVTSFKLLGVWHQNNLKWLRHVEEISKRANKRPYHLRECSRAKLPAKVDITCYLTKIRPLLEYGAPIWGRLPAYLAAELENIQSRSLEERRKTITAREFRRINDDVNHPCHTIVAKPTEHQHNLRTKNICRSVISSTQRHKQSFIPRTTSLINS